MPMLLQFVSPVHENVNSFIILLRTILQCHIKKKKQF